MAPDRHVSTGWTVALAGTAALAMLAASPPVVGGDLGAWISHGFSIACHQIPERSPHLMGGAVALCHRCSGILAGLVLGIAAAPFLSARLLDLVNRSRQGRWLMAALVPTAVDWTLGALNIWANTPVSRGTTGMVFGVVAGLVLGANLVQSQSRSSISPHAHAV